MGQAESKVKEPLKPDPCKVFLDKYIDCVAQHTKGLSDGDDCNPETIAYKNCRKSTKPAEPNKAN